MVYNEIAVYMLYNYMVCNEIAVYMLLKDGLIEVVWNR